MRTFTVTGNSERGTFKNTLKAERPRDAYNKTIEDYPIFKELEGITVTKH